MPAFQTTPGVIVENLDKINRSTGKPQEAYDQLDTKEEAAASLVAATRRTDGA